MTETIKLGQLIHKTHTKFCDLDKDRHFEVLGVSNRDGITRTTHKKSEDLSNYLLIEPNSFAYNPYRINVGSIGLTPPTVTGIVSPAYIVFQTDKEKLIPEVLLDFLKSDEGLRQINQLARGTVRKALRYDDLCEIDFPNLSLEKQEQLVRRKSKFDAKHEVLRLELAHQETLLAQLKQAILHEAVQGKLTADWRQENPDVEPASQLLKRIRGEKQRLVAKKKIRKEKPLPPIAPEEIPFEIPEGWAWCRMLSISENIHYGLTASADFSKQDIRLLRITDIQDGRVNWDSVPGCQGSPKKKENYSLRKGDILIARTGGTVGKSFLVEDLDCKAVFASYLVRVIPIYNSISFYLKQYLGSPPYWNQLNDATIGAQPNVSGTKLKKLVVPLPPLAEQTVIVERVESLLASCRQLEAEIGHSCTQAENLLQAVLKEAFAPKTI